MNRPEASTRGRIKHTCAECKTAWFPMRRELIRAGGVKCPGCGSRFFDISKQGMTWLREANEAKAVRELEDPCPPERGTP